MSEVKDKALRAKQAAGRMGLADTRQKNAALLRMADALIAEESSLIAANEKDLQRGRTTGLRASLLDRLKLDGKRIAAMAEGLRQIAALPDPVGDVLESFTRPNGLRINKVRVPIGVIGIIYEARPNVTVDAAGLCLKTGNTVVLRGGSSALESNRRIVQVLHDALAETELPTDALQLIESADRSSAGEMLKLNGLLDVLIPRGGASLIRSVVENATVPVIETGAGVCHTYRQRSGQRESFPHCDQRQGSASVRLQRNGNAAGAVRLRRAASGGAGRPIPRSRRGAPRLPQVPGARPGHVAGGGSGLGHRV